MSRRGSTADAPRTNGRLTEQELMSALPARSAHREIKVGVFVLLGLVAFFGALFTLTDVGTFRGRYYVATVVESAGGMRRGDPIQMRGVNIGRVTAFEIVPEGVAVELELFDSYPVPEDSHAVLRSSGLLGGMVVDVVPGQSDDPLRDGETLPGSVETGLLGSVAQVGSRADTVLERMTALLSQRTVGAVGESAVELEALLADLGALAAQQRQELAALSGSLRRSAAGIEDVAAGPELERSIARIDEMTARFDLASERLNEASGSLQLVLGRIERGEGTLGMLTADDALYVNMNEAAVGLRELIAAIRADPRRYLNVSVF
jgi:phospholipid/cholesterol/gamma-HCH transport system substrate-binding protein